jgi:hypothetical protein
MTAIPLSDVQLMTFEGFLLEFKDVVCHRGLQFVTL